MILSGTTSILVNGKLTRICGSRFNKALKANKSLSICLDSGEAVTPSKGLSWSDVAALIRAGKKVQAAAASAKRERKSAPKLQAAA